MKKQWVAEAAYFIVALVFIGICIGSGKEQEKEVFGTSVTATPAVDATPGPGETTPVTDKKDDGTGEPGMTPGPDNKDETTAAPVHDTIPTQKPEVTGDEQLWGVPDKTPDIAGSQDIEQIGDEKTGGSSEDAPDTTGGQDKEPTDVPGSMPGAIQIINENYEEYSNEKKAWWFQRKKNHEPSGSGEEFPIAGYSAYYLDKNAQTEDKVIYLTFDCGYENGFTPAILDTLAEKDVKVMFFVTKDFIVKNPDYVKRMKEEGHLVGNHTVRHLSSPDLTPEELEAELLEVARVMEEQTGYSLDPFFRPPMGEYSERTLKATQDMGYASIFWSIAYYDYDVNDQPGKDYVVDHFNTYHHNGSIVLMHNVSESNAQALGDVVDLLRDAGYRFAALTELGK